MPVPLDIKAERTSAGWHTQAIPNAAIPSNIKTTAHTCELIAFKPLTRPIASPVPLLRRIKYLAGTHPLSRSKDASEPCRYEGTPNAPLHVFDTLIFQGSKDRDPHQCIARNVYAPEGGITLAALTLQKCNKTVLAALGYPSMLRLPNAAGGRIDPRLSVATSPLTVNV